MKQVFACSGIMLLAACSSVDAPEPIDAGLAAIVVSEPVRTANGAPAGVSGSRSPAATDDGMAYVSLPPGAFPEGIAATISNLASGAARTESMVNGGFDPVPIPANVGDTLQIEVVNADGDGASTTASVPLRAPPTVIRVGPFKDKKDIPLNVILVVVFSEPMNTATVTRESVQLLDGDQPIAGTVRLSTDGLRAEFTPAELLAPGRTYTLVITTDVRDLQGDPLEERVEVSFTTEILPATQLAFAVPPTETHANQPMVPAVRVAIKDQFGNTVRSATDPVTVALGANPGGATLSGTTTVNAVGGIATFSDLSIDRPGSGHTLVATSGSLTSATSFAFDIVLVFTSVGTGFFYTCGLTATSDVYCWGRNFYGQLGDGTSTGSPTPVLVSGGLGLTSLSVGTNTACGITTARDAYCWGENFTGQLGDGTDAVRLAPVLVTGDLSFVSVSAGDAHSCGITTAGDAYCWGAGRLGDGTAAGSLTPVRVSGTLEFASVSTGGAHTCGLTTGGDAYCWGENGESRGYLFGSGQLGDGTTSNRLTPVPVSGGFRFASLSLGFTYTCGVTSTGDAYCWGRNRHGQLGDGTTVGRLTPTLVSGSLSFASVSPNLGFPLHTCGVTTTGDAYCWGDNSLGQLGDGTTVDRLTPALVSGGLRFVAVSPGAGGHTCGVTTSREVYCWGSNGNGQLGDGTTNGSPTPVRVVQ